MAHVGPLGEQGAAALTPGRRPAPLDAVGVAGVRPGMPPRAGHDPQRVRGLLPVDGPDPRGVRRGRTDARAVPARAAVVVLPDSAWDSHAGPGGLAPGQGRAGLDLHAGGATRWK